MTEGAAALFTFKGLLRGVDANVGVQVPPLAELLTTDVAAVRFLSCVEAYMQLLRQDGLEGFPAERAGFTRLPVCFQVSC